MNGATRQSSGLDAEVMRDVGRFRFGMGRARMIVAEADRELRYTWIANPHPDFDLSDVIGKRDDEILDSEDSRRMLVHQLERFSSDLIDEACLQQETLTLSKRRVNILPFLRESLEGFRAAFEAAPLKLDIEMSDGRLEADVDPDRLTQVLSNVLGNAMKFTPRGGRIEVSVDREAAGVEISIVDNGRGIPPDKLERIFEPFERLDDARDGIGLGLSLAKALIEIHGGMIRATSDGPGAGSTFKLWLPTLTTR